MLEKPAIDDERIAACLSAHFQITAASISFLPRGADQNAAVYEVNTPEGGHYFLKLKRGGFDEISAAIPRYLKDQGIRPIITPQLTTSGRLWVDLDDYAAVIYPFIAGQDGYDAALSKDQWAEFGRAVKQVHSLTLPEDLRSRIRQETFSPRWRDFLTARLQTTTGIRFKDPVAQKTAAYLQVKGAELLRIIARAQNLAQTLKIHTPGFVLCHLDIHPGNLFVRVQKIST